MDNINTARNKDIIKQSSNFSNAQNKRAIYFVRISTYFMIISGLIWLIISLTQRMYFITYLTLAILGVAFYALYLIINERIFFAKNLVFVAVTVHFLIVNIFFDGPEGNGQLKGQTDLWFIVLSIGFYFMQYDFKPFIRDSISLLFLVLFFLFHFEYISFHSVLHIEQRELLSKSTVISALITLYFLTRQFAVQVTKAAELEAEVNNLRNIELKQVLDHLQATQSQLVQSEKMASLGQLTAGVAHEINNPINFVSANIAPLKRDINEIMALLKKYSSLDQGNYQSKLAEILKFKNDIDLSYTINEIELLIKGIEEGSKRTSEIVKGLRNFSRLDEGEIKKASIHEGIESTLLLLNNLVNKKNIEVIKSFGTIPEINCYPGQINQVFMNVLSNAIDAIGESGKIFITTSKEFDKVKISIRDSGKGMSEEVKKKIFDPFFTTKDVGKGTGLGLSIAYGIIEKHNGKIEVRGEEGKGSEFVITLPA